MNQDRKYATMLRKLFMRKTFNEEKRNLFEFCVWNVSLNSEYKVKILSFNFFFSEL